MLTDWVQELTKQLAALAPAGTPLSYPTFVLSLLSVILVSIICGAVGSMVVVNRMAFFSDALAHCAYAGIALGLLVGVATGAGEEFYDLGIPLIMICFGAGVGMAIAFVREKTGLASDTVIGVFFAGALGFGAIFLSALLHFSRFPIEAFLWGDLFSVHPSDLLRLVALLLITVIVLILMYNALVFSSFNPSLARSRRIRQRLTSYVFIVLLALIVNISFRIVGVMLINAFLIVPAATASLVSRNMRQLFWRTVGLALFAGVAGLLLTFEVSFRYEYQIGIGGPIILLSVLLFFVAMAVRPLVIGKQGS